MLDGYLNIMPKLVKLPYGGPITADIGGLSGVNPNSTNLTTWINSVFYPSQSPTSALTVSYDGTTDTIITLEKISSGPILPISLNWTAGRQAATQALSTIVVGGSTVTFTQPSSSASTFGTIMKNVTRNVNTTFTNTVSTTDFKSKVSTVAVNFAQKRYWGFVNTTYVNIDVLFLSSEFATARPKSLSSPVSPSGSQYFLIAFPASFDPTINCQIWVDGFNQTSAFNKTTASLTNAFGYVDSYIFYKSKYPTAGDISFEIK